MHRRVFNHNKELGVLLTLPAGVLRDDRWYALQLSGFCALRLRPLACGVIINTRQVRRFIAAACGVVRDGSSRLSSAAPWLSRPPHFLSLIHASIFPSSTSSGSGP